MSQLYAAIDVGGTKIAAALVDAEGTLLTRAELPTPPRGSAEEVMATVAKLVDRLAEDARWPEVSGVGIGSAGPVDPVLGTVSPVNIPGWRDFPIVDRVRELQPIGGADVLLTGDGSAMAAGEHLRGAARGYDNALCLVVSTGVGAGLILDGALRTGPSGNAGHLGHITVDMDGDDCPCGSRGCLEIFASGTSIARWAVQNGWRLHSDNVVETNSRTTATSAASAHNTSTSSTSFTASTKSTKTSVTTSTTRTTAASPGTATSTANAATTAPTVTTATTALITAADIAASARQGDEIALAAFERAGRALAAGIAATAMLVDIRAAVIGGGVAKAGDVLFDPLRRHLTRYASFPFTRDIAILPATLGSDAGLIGAAAALANATTG
jgi:glucokinase